MNQQQALQDVLVKSPLHVLLMLLAKVLTRSGFADVMWLDRRENWQKSKLGGCELLCQTNLGPYPFKVIIKLVRDSARTRMLDEMAGAIDRTGSDFGIVVATKDLNRKVAANQEKYMKSRIEIIDGKLFAEMLMKFRIGVRPNGDVDYAYFGELQNQLDQVSQFLSRDPFGRRP